MGRLLLAAALIYGAGFPAFDDLRPGALDRAFKTFYRTVNAAIADGRRAITFVDDARRIPDRSIGNIHPSALRVPWRMGRDSNPREA